MGRPFEIIFVDDGSTDGSWELLTDLNDRYPQQIRACSSIATSGSTRLFLPGFRRPGAR